MAETEKDVDVLAELADTALTVTDISQINFEVGTKASVEMGDKLPVVTVEYSNGAKDSPHDMAFAPKTESLAVRRAVLDIMGQVDLQQLCINQEACAVLMDIAYNACNSIVGAHERIYELRTDIYTTTLESVELARNFTVASNSILGGLVKVYEYLGSGSSFKINQLGTILSKIVGYAQKMSEAAQLMSGRFFSLSEQALQEGSEVVKIEGQNETKRKELETQLFDFKAQLEAFQASKNEIEKQIEQAQFLYDKYDREVSELNKKADKMEMASMIMTGVGTAIGSVSSVFSGFSSGSSSKDISGLHKPQGDKDAVNEAARKADAAENAESGEEEKGGQSSDLQKRRTRLERNEEEANQIENRLKEYGIQLEQLEKEKCAADKTRTQEAIDEEIDRIKKMQDGDGARKKELLDQIAEDKSYIKGIQISQIGEKVSDVAEKYEKKIDASCENARSAATEKERLAAKILNLRFELQKKNSENEARIAEFTSRIKNMSLSSMDISVAITSLKLAVTCLSTVSSVLGEVSLLWAGVKSALEHLADDTTIQSLQSALKGSNDYAGIAEYAKTDESFVADWYIMESKWVALHMVCEAYCTSCEKAKDRLNISLRRAESDGLEHWKLAQQMAAEMESKLAINLCSSQSRTLDFKKQIEVLEKAQENRYAELLE